MSESVTIANVGRPSGLPGLVAQAGTGVLSQAVRSAGKIEFHTVFHDARTPTACAKTKPPSTVLPSPSALPGCFASGTVSRVIGRGCCGFAFYRTWCINAERVVVRICYGRECWQAVRSAGLGSTGVYGSDVAGRQVCGQKPNFPPFSVMPAHLRRAQPRIAVRIPAEPFSPDGLVRGRNGVA